MRGIVADKFNQSAFVRSKPLTMSVQDVIKAAKAEHGQKILAGIVYQTRTLMRREKGLPSRRGAQREPKVTRRAEVPATKVARLDAAVTKENELRKLVLQVGVVRSRKVLESLEQLSWS